MKQLIKLLCCVTLRAAVTSQLPLINLQICLKFRLHLTSVTMQIYAFLRPGTELEKN